METKLKSLGLNTYETKVYQTLLEIGASTAHIISKKSNVPHGKIYPVLAQLEQKGLVKEFEGRPKLYNLVNPQIALNQMVLKKQREVNELQKTSQVLQKIFEASTSKEQNQPLQSIEVVYGYKNYLTLSAKLHDKAKKEWLSISRLPIFKPHIDSYKECIDRGVKVKMLGSKTKTNEKNVVVWKDAGVQIKLIRNFPTRFSIIDGKEVVIRFSEDKKYIAIWIKNAALAKGMRDYFMMLWKKAEKV